MNIQTIISVTPHGGEPPNSIAPTGQEVDEVPNSPAPDPAPHTPTDPIVPDSPPPIEDDINMGTDDLQQTIDHQQGVYVCTLNYVNASHTQFGERSTPWKGKWSPCRRRSIGP